MNKSITILIFCFLITSALIGQNATIAGRILDAQAEMPLPGANILIEGTEIGVVSDLNGYFSLTGLSSGDYNLIVSYIGFENLNKQVTLTEGQTMTIEILLKPGVQLGEVVIGGILQGEARSMNVQLNNNNITNVVSSDLMSQYPDANIGDALKRITGINVEYDQGEARFAHIRGTDPALNSIMINGERMPSAEGGTRSNQLDLVPASMIKEVQVNKSLTPEMDADAIGGSVNLVTRQASSNQRIAASVGTGYNFVAKKPLFTGNLILGSRFANNKFGVLFSGTLNNDLIGSDNIEAEWEEDDDGNVYTSDMQVRQYYLQRIRQSYTLNLDYAINGKNTIYLNGMYSNRKDYENRYRLRYKDMEYNEDGTFNAEIRRQTKGGKDDIKNARLENQNVMNFTLGGNHLFGKIEMKWHGTYAKASEERPTERYISYRYKDVTVTQDNSNPKEPHVYVQEPADANDLNINWGLKELTEENQYTDEIDYNGRLDFTIPILDNQFKNAIKVGARYRGKQKQRDNDFYEYEPLDEDAFNGISMDNLADESKSDFLAGDYEIGHFVNKEYLGQLSLQDANQFEKTVVPEEYAGNFTASENIVAGYVALEQNFGEKFFMILGLRVEQTSNTSEGFSYDAEEDELSPTPSETSSYTNFLPNLQLKYNISPKSVLRFAYTNTLGRPNYFDLVPYQEVYLEDGEIKIGNPDLNPTESMNIDLMYEYYFKNIGLVSVGAYYKNISNFIIEQTLRDYDYNGTTWDKFVQPVNGGDADLIGFEVAYRQSASFANGAWKGLGWYLGYNYNYSQVKNFNLEGREDEDIALPGSPQNMFNVSLIYEYAGWLARVSMNYTSAFRDTEGVGESAFYDRWYDDQLFLDLNIGYSFANYWQVYFNARNLTNQPLRYYQGIEDRTMQAEYYNTTLQLGVRFDLTKPLSK